ncbi:hypothetical protein NTGM5_240004 [Candidatus Nitrotoga sp. M5]|nr:hypothetical protein NTGM5_240004 [Candidatus Nitrotoga sp. M5]
MLYNPQSHNCYISGFKHYELYHTFNEYGFSAVCHGSPTFFVDDDRNFNLPTLIGSD